MRAFEKLVGALLLVGAMVITPAVAQAGLIGDTVAATLQDTDAPATIFTGTAVVTDPGAPEFSGTFASISWTLDVLNNGFLLQANCLNDPLIGCDSGAITFTLSDLDFTPPATLVALSNIVVTEPLLTSVVGPPLVGPSSVTINFQSFSLGTGSTIESFISLASSPTTSSYAADFTVESRAVSTPFPGTLLILAIGLAAAAILTVWRRRLS